MFGKAPEIPINPKPGEVWFSINLNLIDDAPELYNLLKKLGFPAPKLAYRQLPDELEIHLLLDHLQLTPDSQPPHDLYQQEQQILSDVIDPDAISFRCGLLRQTA